MLLDPGFGVKSREKEVDEELCTKISLSSCMTGINTSDTFITHL